MNAWIALILLWVVISFPAGLLIARFLQGVEDMQTRVNLERDHNHLG